MAVNTLALITESRGFIVLLEKHPTIPSCFPPFSLILAAARKKIKKLAHKMNSTTRINSHNYNHKKKKYIIYNLN